MWAKANLLAALAATAIGGCRALPHEHRGARSSPATARASRPSMAELSRAIALTSELQYPTKCPGEAKAAGARAREHVKASGERLF